jgi:hypothetical protein
MDDPQRTGGRRQTEYHHERPADPVEASDRPYEDKAPAEADPGPVHEPGAGEPPDTDRDPHHQLNNPVDEPDPTSDSDPYEDAS